MATRVVVSDAAIISACNTDRGSGGVARWLTRTANKVIAVAEASAPVGNPLDNKHRPEHVVGTYKASFIITRKYGNGHRIFRHMGNIAPYAAYVENGRTESRLDQRFSSVAYPEIHWTDFTPAREGLHILENALDGAVRTRLARKKITRTFRSAEFERG